MNNETIGTPSDIDVLLHCHVSPIRHPRAEAPAVKESLRRFCRLGVLENSGDLVYRTTPLGKAWVELLCRTELPSVAFLDAQGLVIKST